VFVPRFPNTAFSAMSSYNNNNNIISRNSRTSASAYARPRSVYCSPSRSGSGSVYSSLGLSAPYHTASSSYSSSVPSYSTSTYGGTASGYGGLTITPSSSASFSSYRTTSPSSRQSLASPSSRQLLVTPLSSRQSLVTPSSLRQPQSISSSFRQSHAPLKRNYYQSPLSRFDSSNSLASNKSNGSEGYMVSGDQCNDDFSVFIVQILQNIWILNLFNVNIINKK